MLVSRINILESLYTFDHVFMVFLKVDVVVCYEGMW